MQMYKKDKDRTIASYILTIVNIAIIIALCFIVKLNYYTIRIITLLLSVLGIVLTVILNLIANKAPYSKLNTLILKIVIVFFVVYLVFLAAAGAKLFYK